MNMRWKVNQQQVLGAAGSLQKKFLAGLKNARFLSREKMPDFIGRNPLFFTKIHQTGKSCQSYRRFQNPICDVIRWRLIFEIRIVSVVS